MRCLILLSLLVPSVGAFAQFDAPVRQHAAHVHGQAEGQLAVDGSSVQLSLQIPAHNLLGFEHAPVNEAQRSALDATVRHLEESAWLQTPPAADCQRQELTLDTPGLEAPEDGSAHHHHHAHEHDHGGDEHGAFELTIQLDCRVPEALTWLELDLFEAYPANESIRLDLLTATRADRITLGPGRIRVDLQP